MKKLELTSGDCYERIVYVPRPGAHIESMKREMRAVALLSGKDVHGGHNGRNFVAFPSGEIVEGVR